MNREFVQSRDISLRAGDALLDPLVINFDGNAAELTDRKFAFQSQCRRHERKYAICSQREWHPCL